MGRGEYLTRWGEHATTLTDYEHCRRCGGRMMRVLDYYSHEIKWVCRGGCPAGPVRSHRVARRESERRVAVAPSCAGG